MDSNPVLVRSEEEMQQIGARIADKAGRSDVITLSGSLGAGKTVFAKGFIRALGYEGEVASPSYALVHDYMDAGLKFPVLHADLYRVERADELRELGLDEALSTGILLVEWPERLETQSWPDMLRLGIEIMEDGTRRLTAQVPPSWEDRWPFR